MGKVLIIDLATLQVTCVLTASVTVEVDLGNSLPDRIWISIGQDGFWKPIKSVNCLSLCFSCHKIGHDMLDCKNLNKEKKENEGLKPAPLPFDTSISPNQLRTHDVWQS